MSLWLYQVEASSSASLLAIMSSGASSGLAVTDVHLVYQGGGTSGPPQVQAQPTYMSSLHLPVHP